MINYQLVKIMMFLLAWLATPVQAAYQTFHSEQPLSITILGVNDFHGQISTGRRLEDRPVGSAAVLAAYLKAAQRGKEDHTLLALMGDSVGASPPASGLLHDEPSILFFNSLGNAHCQPTNRMDPACNIVATLGNHEFDKGEKAILDLINGTRRKPSSHWIDLPQYPGASYPYISANIVDANTGETIFPPYVIKKVNGVSVAFIGAILKNAPEVIIPAGIYGLKFLDEADSINRYIPEVKAKGATVIVVIMHQGGYQAFYAGPTQAGAQTEGFHIRDIVNRLDDSVDVVMGGHTHQFMNGFLSNSHGKQMLVTEANCYSASFAEVTLSVDPSTHLVINKSAQIVNAFADAGPGLTPDPDVKKLINLAEEAVDHIISRKISVLKNDLLKKGNDAGESNLGDLVADAYREAFDVDIGLNNPGGLRADLYAGQVTYGTLYAIQPFANHMVKMAFTGDEIYAVFEQQWTPTNTNILQISGLTYTYDLTQPRGHRINTIYFKNAPLDRNKIYTVATNDFLAGGGDGFTLMQKGQILETGITDLEALVNHVRSLSKPFSVEIEGRIKAVEKSPIRQTTMHVCTQCSS